MWRESVAGYHSGFMSAANKCKLPTVALWSARPVGVSSARNSQVVSHKKVTYPAGSKEEEERVCRLGGLGQTNATLGEAVPACNNLCVCVCVCWPGRKRQIHLWP